MTASASSLGGVPPPQTAVAVLGSHSGCVRLNANSLWTGHAPFLRIDLHHVPAWFHKQSSASTLSTHIRTISFPFKLRRIRLFTLMFERVNSSATVATMSSHHHTNGFTALHKHRLHLQHKAEWQACTHTCTHKSTQTRPRGQISSGLHLLGSSHQRHGNNRPLLLCRTRQTPSCCQLQTAAHAGFGAAEVTLLESESSG